MSSTTEQLCGILTVVHEAYKLMDTADEAIRIVRATMETVILPLLMPHREEARVYCTERDKVSGIIKLALHDEIVKLKQQVVESGLPAHVLAMSSVMSGLNLIEGSDADIGLCIDGLCDNASGYVDNQDYLVIAEKILVSNGYSLTKRIGYLANWANPANRYLCYEKHVDGIEFEVKVRDLKNTQSIIDLHHKLDTELTEEKRELYTYGKYLLNDTSCKKILKLFIYMEYFDGIEGRVKLPAV
jgi:hypothetical protein